MKKEKELLEVVDSLEINDGQVLLDGATDITDQPMMDYLVLGKDGYVFSRPYMFECRSEGTSILPEVDGDRVFYRVYWRNKEMAFCHSRQEAEKVLDYCEEMQREAEHCKDESPFPF